MTAQVIANVRIDRQRAVTYKGRAELSTCTTPNWVGQVSGVALSSIGKERLNKSCGKNSLIDSLYLK